MSENLLFRILTEDDWRSPAWCDNAVVRDGYLTLAQGSEGKFRSRPMDSGVGKCVWHRVVVDAEIPENAFLTLRFGASEERNASVFPLADGEASACVLRGSARDALIPALPATTGRFLQVEITLHCEGVPEELRLRRLKAYYPRRSYLRYLPALYSRALGEDDPKEHRRRRDLLERFLSLFESLMHEVDEMIAGIPALFDPLAAPDDLVPRLAGWLSLERYEYGWLDREGKTRELILRAWELYRNKGTADGLAFLASFLLGKPCLVKEYANNVFRSFGMEHREAEETVGADGRLSFYHEPSTSLDLGKADLLQRRGTYEDKIHYVLDTSGRTPHAPWEVGIFVHLEESEMLDRGEEEIRQTERILRSFLPVRIHAGIRVIQEFGETCRIDPRWDAWRDSSIRTLTKESFTEVAGTYVNEADWRWLGSWNGEERGRTNDARYRSVNVEIGPEQDL